MTIMWKDWCVSVCKRERERERERERGRDRERETTLGYETDRGWAISTEQASGPKWTPPQSLSFCKLSVTQGSSQVDKLRQARPGQVIVLLFIVFTGLV